MSKVLLDKIHARYKEMAIEQGIDLNKIKDSGESVTDPKEGDIWLAYVRCFFEAAKEIRDDFFDQGLLNTVKAMDALIAEQRKFMRHPAEMKVVSEVLDFEELA